MRQRLLIHIRRDLPALTVLKLLHHILRRLPIEMRQIQMHIIEHIIHLDMHLQRRPHHPSQKLRDIRRILRVAERHHRLRTRTIPSRRQILLEKDHPDLLILRDPRRLPIRHRKPRDHDIPIRLAERMHHLPRGKLHPNPILDLLQTRRQIRLRELLAAPIGDLQKKDRIHIRIMLLLAIPRPMIPLLPPIIRRRLQNRHIIIRRILLRIRNHNPILQKPRSPHRIRRHNHLMHRRRRILHQPIETLHRRRHPDHHRHRRKSIRFAPLQKLLHDRRRPARILPLHPAMRLIDNEIQPVSLFLHRLRERLPDRIRPAVPVLRQIRRRRQLLRIQEIHPAILQDIPIKRHIRDRLALPQPNPIRLPINLEL